MSVKRQLFVSCHARGLELGAEQIGLGLPLILGFTLLPQPANVTALPTRYNVANSNVSVRWYGRRAAWLDKEALSLSPVFKLSRNCSIGVASLPQQHALAAAAAPHALQQLRSLTSHPLQSALADLDSSSSTSSTEAAVAPPTAVSTTDQPTADSADAAKHRDQLEQHYPAAAAAADQDDRLPWLGADLDIAGYTKKGYMRGGGKDQNQDRGLIMQQFRIPGEILLGVFDGHGSLGHLVSTYIVQHLPAVIMQRLVTAAAALHSSSSSSGDDLQHDHHDKHRHKGSKQQQQQQQLQYVVIPDHSGNGSSSSWFMDLHEQQQQQQDNGQKPSAIARRGRLVSRHKVVHQPEHVQLDPCSSSSSKSNDQGPRDQIVSSRALNQVPLSKGVLRSAFVETDHMLNCSGINVLDSGSTAIITHIDHDQITAAWVGDSRAVLGRRLVSNDHGLKGSKQQQQQLWQQWGDGSSSSAKWQVIQLSDDHKPERPDEQLRILMNNGRVEQMKNVSGVGVGPHRVWFKQIDYPGLAMSRAFGDAPCRRIGVTVEPQLYVHRLTAADQILVAASDGVWEYMTNQEAIDLVGGCPNASTAARKLVEAAEQRWQQVEKGNYIDDITAVVLMATPRHKQVASKL